MWTDSSVIGNVISTIKEDNFDILLLIDHYTSRYLNIKNDKAKKDAASTFDYSTIFVTTTTQLVWLTGVQTQLFNSPQQLLSRTHANFPNADDFDVSALDILYHLKLNMTASLSTNITLWDGNMNS